MNNCDTSQALLRAEEIRKALADRPIQTARGPLSVTMSMGVLSSRDWNRRSPTEILCEVDAALYRAKASGRNRSAFRAKYPPTTPMIVGNIEEIRLDEPVHELYATDSYLGGRVMVFDLDTLAFKRGWGAYGKPLSEMSTDDADRKFTPNGPMPKEFRGHLTLNISNDGFVYAADRMANRIQVTTKQGKFVKEFILAPSTGQGGSTGGVAFSPDKAQKFLFISDLTTTTSGSSTVTMAKSWDGSAP